MGSPDDQEIGADAGPALDPALDPLLGEDPYAALEQATSMVRYRAILLLVAVALVGFSVWQVRDELGFWLASPPSPVDLGDVRAQWRSGAEALPARHNTWVKMRGLVPTRAQATETHTYVQCPLFDIIVRTDQPLPRPPQRVDAVRLDPALLTLVQQRRAHPENLMVALAAEGRLLSFARAPRWARRILGAYLPYLQRPPQETWFLVDGDRPERYRAFGWVLLVGTLLLIATTWLLLRAVRQREALRQRFVRG